MWVESHTANKLYRGADGTELRRGSPISGSASLAGKFSEDKLDRDELWISAEKITCTHNKRFDQLSHEFGVVVTVELHDSSPKLERMVERPIGLERPVMKS